MKIRTLKDIPELDSKRVLLRVDFNVPMNKEGQIQDNARILGALPTIKFLQEKKAKIILISHMGRPKGQPSDHLKLNPVAAELESLIAKPVKKLDTILDSAKEIDGMQPGEIILLENIRFDDGEESCDPEFTKKLASLGEIFVNDAFGTAHRKHASTAGLAEHLPAYAGLLMEKEITELNAVLHGNPPKPLTMIFGGAKIDTKIGIIKNFLDKADYFLIGGGLANTFLHAAGHNVADSLYQADKTGVAQEIINPINSPESLVIPHDVIVSDQISNDAPTQNVSSHQVPADMKILDIGQQTTAKFQEIVAKSGTVIWNGPLGLSEFAPFANGTLKVAKTLAESHATSIIGGGDTAEAIKRFQIPEDKFTHISTGGGACLEFLSGETLPGIECLVDHTL